MSTVNDTLTERHARYGALQEQAEWAIKIKDVLEASPNWGSLPPYQKEALHMIASKISRALVGSHTYTDNWHDIAGYATLVENQLNWEQGK